MSNLNAFRHHLFNYLYDGHTQSRHHLYELVQYTRKIVPRLYLMIMKDIMEMSRTPHAGSSFDTI